MISSNRFHREICFVNSLYLFFHNVPGNIQLDVQVFVHLPNFCVGKIFSALNLNKFPKNLNIEFKKYFLFIWFKTPL